MKRKIGQAEEGDPGEFLWLISLSDLMILLFIFFVVLYSFSYKKLKQSDFVQILSAFGNDEVKDPADKIKSDVTDWVRKNKLTGQIEVAKRDGAVVVEIKDKVFFGSGQYKLHRKGKQTLASLAKAISSIPADYKIGIEGHTDDIPIRTKHIANNWELSAKRAVSVFSTLNLPKSVQERVVIMAYGDTRPIVDNRDKKGNPIPANQSKNRRVTLRIF